MPLLQKVFRQKFREAKLLPEKELEGWLQRRGLGGGWSINFWELPYNNKALEQAIEAGEIIEVL